MLNVLSETTRRNIFMAWFPYLTVVGLNLQICRRRSFFVWAAIEKGFKHRLYCSNFLVFCIVYINYIESDYMFSKRIELPFYENLKYRYIWDKRSENKVTHSGWFNLSIIIILSRFFVCVFIKKVKFVWFIGIPYNGTLYKK